LMGCSRVNRRGFGIKQRSKQGLKEGLLEMLRP
jgi:hypothetical protein